jgi:hypothetical protein
MCVRCQVIPTVGVEGPDGEKRRLAMLKAFSTLVCETASRAKFLQTFQRRPSGEKGSGALASAPAAEDGWEPGAEGAPSGKQGDRSGGGALPGEADGADVADEGDGDLEIEVSLPAEVAAGGEEADGLEWESVREEEAEDDDEAKEPGADRGSVQPSAGDTSAVEAGQGEEAAPEQRQLRSAAQGDRGGGSKRVIETVNISSSSSEGEQEEDEDGSGGKGAARRRREGRREAEPDQALAELVDGYGSAERGARAQRQASGALAGAAACSGNLPHAAAYPGNHACAAETMHSMPGSQAQRSLPTPRQLAVACSTQQVACATASDVQYTHCT